MRHSMLCALISTVLCLPYFYCAPVPTLPGKGRTISANKVGSGHDVIGGSDPDAGSNDFFIHYGYMKRPGEGKHVDAAGREKAIRKFQKMAGLKNTGLLDKETQDKMNEPRCDDADYDPDIDVENNGTSRTKRYTTTWHPWEKRHLTWRLVNYTPDIPDQEQQRQAIKEALQQWSNVSPLTFQEVTSGADIELTFAPPYHLDICDHYFRSTVLAHAYLPQTGSVHFNEAVQFTPQYLKIVALHELGHSLGIKHTHISGAIMYPYITDTAVLHSDDIAAIQSLYP